MFQTDGGWQGMRLIAGVDMVIGPTLTLLVYKKTKPSIKFDLSIIATLQMLCIVGGMATVWYSKPLAVIYADGTYYTSNRLSYKNISTGEIDINTIPLLKQRQPVWISIDLPLDLAQRSLALGAWSFFKHRISLATDLYQPYYPKAISHLKSEGLSYQEALEKWGITFNKESEQIRFFKLNGRFKERVLAVDVSDGTVLDALRIDTLGSNDSLGSLENQQSKDKQDLKKSP